MGADNQAVRDAIIGSELDDGSGGCGTLAERDQDDLATTIA